MYDIKKRIALEKVTVSKMISALNTLPKDALFCCCGTPFAYIHIEEDGSVVSIDHSDLGEDYWEYLDEEYFEYEDRCNYVYKGGEDDEDGEDD